jgi:hypothetical protein
MYAKPFILQVTDIVAKTTFSYRGKYSTYLFTGELCRNGCAHNLVYFLLDRIFICFLSYLDHAGKRGETCDVIAQP